MWYINQEKNALIRKKNGFSEQELQLGGRQF
jgi:hypothetical protein